MFEAQLDEGMSLPLCVSAPQTHFYTPFCCVLTFSSALDAITQELYITRQWPCPCVNTSIACGADASKINNVQINETILAVNGTRYPIHVLQPGVWYNTTIMNNYDVEYFKFHVPYVAGSCPIIVIEKQHSVGSIDVYLSANAIPSEAHSDWLSIFDAPSTIAICPNNNKVRKFAVSLPRYRLAAGASWATDYQRVS